MNIWCLIVIILSILFTSKPILSEDRFSEVALYNSEYNRVSGAKVMVDSFTGIYFENRRLYLVECEKNGLKKCVIHIEHKDYEELSIVYDFSHHGTTNVGFFLRRKGEPYYLNRGQRIPYIPNAGKLLVRIKSEFKGEILDSAKAIDLVMPLFDSLNLLHSSCPPREKIDNYPSAIRDSSYGKHTFDYLYILQKKDGSDFDQNKSEILGILRSSDKLDYAGPLICNSKACFPPFYLSNNATIHYYHYVSEKTLDAEIEKLFNLSVEVLEVNKIHNYIRVSFEKSMGQIGVISLLEELMEESESISSIQNDIGYYFEID